MPVHHHLAPISSHHFFKILFALNKSISDCVINSRPLWRFPLTVLQQIDHSTLSQDCLWPFDAEYLGRLRLHSQHFLHWLLVSILETTSSVPHDPSSRLYDWPCLFWSYTPYPLLASDLWQFRQVKGCSYEAQSIVSAKIYCFVRSQLEFPDSRNIHFGGSSSRIHQLTSLSWQREPGWFPGRPCSWSSIADTCASVSSTYAKDRWRTDSTGFQTLP